MDTEVLDKVERKVGERVDVMFNIEQSSVKELGDGTFSTIVTTASVDRMRESIDTSGITTDAYMQNPVVLYGHDYQGLPIGKALKLTKQKDPDTGKKVSMKATFQLAVEEYPFAATVAAMIKGGYLNAVSIGGIVKEWNEDYTVINQMEMVEFSVVPVPANPEALISGRSFQEATGKSVEEVAKEFHDFVGKSIAQKVKTLDSGELDRHIESLEKLLGILKASRADNVESKSTQEHEVIRLTIRKAGAEVTKAGEQIIRLVKAKE